MRLFSGSATPEAAVTKRPSFHLPGNLQGEAKTKEPVERGGHDSGDSQSYRAVGECPIIGEREIWDHYQGSGNDHGAGEEHPADSLPQNPLHALQRGSDFPIVARVSKSLTRFLEGIVIIAARKRHGAPPLSFAEASL